MLGYVTIGVSDMERAESFYTELFAEIGGKMIMDGGRIKFFGFGKDKAMLAICVPYNEEPQNCGNGNMIAIAGGSDDGVDALYKKAIELGAQDEGEPGSRLPIFYGAYVRDFDNNKICFYDMKVG